MGFASMFLITLNGLGRVEILERRFPFGLLLALSVVCACSSDSNLLGLSVPDDQKNAFDAQTSLARAYYDEGEFDQALIHAQAAFAANPDSEETAVVLGYVLLAQSGVTPFLLAKKLVKDGKDSEEGSGEGGSPQGVGGEETSSDDSAEAGKGAGEGAGDALQNLGGVIGLTDEDYLSLGTLNGDFPELPVIEPFCAGEARAKVEKLAFTNQAIAAICPFVDPEALLPEEPRHRCFSNRSTRLYRPESHVLWAFAHLTEALVFFSVLNFKTDGRSKSNLELRVAQLEDLDVKSIADIPLLLEKIEGLTNTVDKVLQVTGFCAIEYPQTQLVALVNDLVAVSLAFGRIPGLPKKMTEKIDKSIARVRKIREKTSGLAGTEEQAKAAKGDLTKKISESIAGAIGKINPDQVSPEQAEEACQALEGLGDGADGDGGSIPDFCQ